MRLLFLMDPMETVLTAKDTTFGMMLAASARGHECHHALPLHLEADRGELSVAAARVHVSREEREGVPHDDWRLDARAQALVTSFDAVMIRKDPPFDANYAYTTQLLEAVRDRTLVVNDPRGLRDANEKLYAIHFSRWTPRTIVTATPTRIREFVREVGGQAVIKPLDGMAGAGIFLLRDDDKNFNAIVEATIGEFGRTFCMVQEYLPAAREGDKRILLLDGEPLGAILRVPRADEARANIHVGGTVVKAEITDHERAMIADMAPRLRRDGLWFVGLDVIGGKLTEVNVTSPTGIQQMQRLDGVDYSAKVIAWLEARTKR
jgi:glutathione synthase